MRVWKGGGGEGGEGLLARASYEGAVGAVAVRNVRRLDCFRYQKKIAFCQFFPNKAKNTGIRRVYLEFSSLTFQIFYKNLLLVLPCRPLRRLAKH